MNHIKFFFRARERIHNKRIISSFIRAREETYEAMRYEKDLSLVPKMFNLSARLFFSFKMLMEIFLVTLRGLHNIAGLKLSLFGG